MRKVLGLSVLVGAFLGALVGFLAVRLSRVSTFAVPGLSLSGPRRAVEFRPAAQQVVPWGVLGGIAVALLIVAVTGHFGVRIVRDPTCPRGQLLTAVCVAAGVALGAVTVVLVHYASWTAVVHTPQFGLDTVSAERPSWLLSLPISIGIGAIVGAVAGQVFLATGVRLVSRKKDRSLIAASAGE